MTSATASRSSRQEQPRTDELQRMPFIGSWQINDWEPRASLRVHLIFFPEPFTSFENGEVTGSGQLIIARMAPIHLHLSGDYGTLNSKSGQHPMIALNGYPIEENQPHGPNGSPIGLPFLKLRILLESDWMSGRAYFLWRPGDVWERVNDAPVEAIMDVAKAGSF